MIGTPEWKGRQGRDRFAMVATDQGLMAIGGHNSYRKVPQKSTEIYTSSAGVWLPGPKMENERFGHEVTQMFCNINLNIKYLGNCLRKFNFCFWRVNGSRRVHTSFR